MNDDLETLGLNALDAAEAKDNDDKKGEDDDQTDEGKQEDQDAKGDQGDDQDDSKEDQDGESDSDDEDQGDGSEDSGDSSDLSESDQDATDVVSEEKKEYASIADYADASEYVKDKLPEIEVKGRIGDDGELTTFKVKTAADLPDDFVPESYKSQTLLNEALTKNANAAEGLIREYADSKANADTEKFKQDFENSIIKEIDAAMTDGRIPEIKAKENTKEYSEDPGVKRTAQVIEHMQKENVRLAKAGSPYRVQSFTQALDLLEAQELKQQQKQQKAKEDDIIKKRGDMVGGGKGEAASDSTPRIRPGESIDDIVSRHYNDLDS